MHESIQWAYKWQSDLNSKLKVIASNEKHCFKTMMWYDGGSNTGKTWMANYIQEHLGGKVFKNVSQSAFYNGWKGQKFVVIDPFEPITGDQFGVLRNLQYGFAEYDRGTVSYHPPQIVILANRAPPNQNEIIVYGIDNESMDIVLNPNYRPARCGDITCGDTVHSTTNGTTNGNANSKANSKTNSTANSNEGSIISYTSPTGDRIVHHMGPRPQATGFYQQSKHTTVPIEKIHTTSDKYVARTANLGTIGMLSDSKPKIIYSDDGLLPDIRTAESKDNTPKINTSENADCSAEFDNIESLEDTATEAAMKKFITATETHKPKKSTIADMYINKMNSSYKSYGPNYQSSYYSRFEDENYYSDCDDWDSNWDSIDKFGNKYSKQPSSSKSSNSISSANSSYREYQNFLNKSKQVNKNKSYKPAVPEYLDDDGDFNDLDQDQLSCISNTVDTMNDRVKGIEQFVTEIADNCNDAASSLEMIRKNQVDMQRTNGQYMLTLRDLTNTQKVIIDKIDTVGADSDAITKITLPELLNTMTALAKTMTEISESVQKLAERQLHNSQDIAFIMQKINVFEKVDQNSNLYGIIEKIETVDDRLAVIEANQKTSENLLYKVGMSTGCYFT